MGAKNLYHRTMLMTLYGTGLRRELLQLKVRDIDRQRMVLRVEHGKGGHDREVPLSPTLLTALREYYRWMRPQTYLFPGTKDGWRTDRIALIMPHARAGMSSDFGSNLGPLHIATRLE